MSKRTSSWMAAAFVSAALMVSPLMAQSNTLALEDQIRKARKEITKKRDSALEILLTLTPEQGKVFWPLQKEYDKELKRLGKEERDLLRDFGKAYDKLTVESAAKIAERFFSLEQERLTLQENTFQKVSDQVSPVVAVQFIQLQRQFETELAMERMKLSPLAQER